MDSITKRLRYLGFDAIFLVNDSNIRYVSNYSGTDSYVLLLSNGEKYFLTDYRYSEQAKEECPHFNIISVNREIETLEQKISEIAHHHQLRKIAYESNHLICQLHSKINTAIGDIEFVPSGGLIEELRYLKTNTEINNVERAAHIADMALDKFLGTLRPGISEKAAARKLEDLLFEYGAEEPAFPIILVAGKNSSRPHGIPSSKIVETGEIITIDFGALYKGYRSDMTRTVVIGAASDKQRQVYNIVQEAQEKGLKALCHGITGREVNQIVNDVIKFHGYLEFAGKGIGHGVGLDIHEKPMLNNRCSEKLQKNSIITIEPGIYIPGWGGVRIEDTVLITQDGHRSLTSFPKDLLEL